MELTLTHYILLIWLAIINVVAFVAYGADKWKAKHHRWRIPERTLLTLAFIGGGIGAYLGIRIFDHKTRHWQFQVLVPLAILLWAAGLMWLWCFP